MPDQRTYRSLSTAQNKQQKKSGEMTKFIVVAAIILIGFIVAIMLLSRSQPEEESQDDQSEEQGTQEEEEPTETEDTESEETVEIDATEKEDTETADGVPQDGNFSTDDQEAGDENVADVTITEFEQKAYNDFYRLSFTFDSESIPFVTAILDQDSNLIGLKLRGIAEDNSGIAPGNGADVTGSVVSTVFHNVTSEKNVARYSIGIKESTGFYLQALEDPSRIVLDIQEQDVENGDEQEFAYSSDAQSIAGDATGNEIFMSGISHSNQGDAYRIIYRLGSSGTGKIPQVEAEIVDHEGGNAIKVTIANLSSDFAAEGNYDVEYGDRSVSGMSGTYADGVSTYYIVITSEREYKLYYRTAPAQVIVDVKR